MKGYSNSSIALASFIIMAICLCANCAFCESISEDDCKVVLLSSETDPGKKLNVFLFLPAKSKNYSSWALYDASGTKFVNQALDINPSIKNAVLQLSDSGKYNVVLMIFNNDNVVKCMSKEQVVIQEGWLLKLITSWSGVVIGAVMAITVFVLQNWIRLRMDKIRDRKFVKSLLLSLIDRLIGREEHSIPEVPDWLADPVSSKWADTFSEEPFATSIMQISSVIVRIRKVHISKNEAIKQLTKIRKEL